MLENDGDRLFSIRMSDGVPVRTDAGLFCALFDRAFAEVSMGDIEMEGRRPVLICRSCDVVALRKDATVDVEGLNLKVMRLEPDTPAPGWTTVLLRE